MKADCHLTANQDDRDAFSLCAKRVQVAFTTMQDMDPLSTASANFLAVEEGHVGSKNEDDRAPCKSPVLVSESHSLKPHDGAAPSEMLEFPPCQAHDNGPPVVHEHHAYICPVVPV